MTLPWAPVGTRTWRAAVLFIVAICASAFARADIVVGQVSALSGPQGVTGRAIRAGAQLCFDAVNAQGGVRGKPIRLVSKDDAQKPEDTVRLATELIKSESPVALLGTIGTSNLEALARDGLLPRTKVPMVGAISGAASVVQAQGMLVVKASYRDEVDRLFAALSGQHMRRIGLVYQDDGLGKDVLAGANDAAPRHGVELVARASYARNTVDTSEPVSRMLQAQPQAIFLGATTAAAIDFVKRYRAAGGGAVIYGMSIIDTEAMLKALGPEVARGYAFTTVLPLQSQTKIAVVREYLSLRAASRDPDLSARSIEGFFAAKTLVWALNRAPRVAPEAVAEALALPGGFDLGGFRLDFSRQGPGSHFVDFAMFGAGGRVVH